jgi:hypothetical protein
MDQVLLLLREQLQRAGQSKAARKEGKAAVERAARKPLARMRALAALDTLEEEDLRRAVVRGLLIDQFGDGISNDPAFVSIVDDVFRIIGETPGGAELVDRAVAQLKEGRS